MWVKSFRRLVLWDPGVAAGVTLQHLCKEPSCDGVSGVDRFGDVGRVSLPPPWEWVILPMVLDGMGGPELYSKPGSACSPPPAAVPSWHHSSTFFHSKELTVYDSSSISSHAGFTKLFPIYVLAFLC